MAIPITIEECIEQGRDAECSHRTLNGSAILHYTHNGKNISIPINPLINKYRDFFDEYILVHQLTEIEQRTYRFAPKKFSLDMYGTTEFWSIILYLNDCHSILDFQPTVIKFIDNTQINGILNEILILEDLI